MNRKFVMIRLMLSLLLFFSGFSHAEPDETLLSEAQNGIASAQYQLAQKYQQDNNLSLAHYWYIRALISGNLPAANALGKLFENAPEAASDALSLAKNWYQAGADNQVPGADENYDRILKKQFDQQKARQISAMSLLDKKADEDLDHPRLPPDPVLTPVEPSSSFTVEILIIGILVLIIAIAVTVKRGTKRRKQRNEDDIRQQLNQQKQQCQTLQKQLEQTKKALYSSQQTKQLNKKGQDLAIAYALLGFSSGTPISEAMLKTRYKKLSRIYHPDISGSQEEMKRLNSAVKIIKYHLHKTT